jgi:hypothetical protein
MQSFAESFGLHAFIHEHQALQAEMVLVFWKRIRSDEALHLFGLAQDIEALL